LKIKKTPVLLLRKTSIFCYNCLFAFKAVAARAAIRFFIAGVADVDFAERTIIARTIVFTFRYTATDGSIHFSTVFVHHKTSLLSIVHAIFFLRVKTVYANPCKIIDISKILLYNEIERT
jgi:hypothetical protein